MSRRRAARIAARIATGLVCAAGPASAAASGTARAAAKVKDYAIIARDIIPSGEFGSVPPPANAADQAMMYDALTPLFNHVTPADLDQDFKVETLGTTGAGPVTNDPVPKAGVTILRDSFDVPHIYGATRDDVTWGAGWALAEDRGLLLQQARYDSTVAAIDAPGLSAIDMIGKLETFQPSAQTEAALAK
jgi:hypothetical protein